MTEDRNACGVWPRRRDARGGMSLMVSSGRDLDDRVGRRDGDVDGLVVLERLEALLDDARRHQRAHRVVEEHVALLVAERCASARSVVSLRVSAPSRMLADLGVAAVADDRADRVEVARRHHHDDLVDHRVAVQRGERVLEDRPARRS